ncbi:hypothetical protein BRD05_03090 [Halobacteriales archaeon QS_9_70_65]|nr:MAG: hypothetical protein BRD05_03090 [Halobacteriales archaeon QS_9_70_65]
MCLPDGRGTARIPRGDGGEDVPLRQNDLGTTSITVARTLSFLAVGVVLLAASYIHARARDDGGVDLPGRG